MWKKPFLLVALLIAVCSTAAEARQECTNYARNAIQQVNTAAASRCGFSGPRWSTDEGLHYGYCIYSYDHNQVANLNTENSLRAGAIQNCQKQAAEQFLRQLVSSFGR